MTVFEYIFHNFINKLVKVFKYDPSKVYGRQHLDPNECLD